MAPQGGGGVRVSARTLLSQCGGLLITDIVARIKRLENIVRPLFRETLVLRTRGNPGAGLLHPPMLKLKLLLWNLIFSGS